MSEKKWYLIANEDVAVIFKDDEVIVMPDPSLGSGAEMRAVFPLGSKAGYRTFGPGHRQRSFKLASEGPVLTHSEMPEDLKKRVLDIMKEHCQFASPVLQELIDTALHPKQKENQGG